MVREKQDVAELKVNRTVTSINRKRSRLKSILFKIEDPVNKWNQGMKRF